MEWKAGRLVCCFLLTNLNVLVDAQTTASGSGKYYIIKEFFCFNCAA